MKQSVSFPIIILLLVLVGVLYYMNGQLKQNIAPILDNGNIAKAEAIDSLIQLSDSLQGELFIQSTIVGRYELTLEHFKNVNPQAAQEFEDFLNKQTE